MSLVGNLLTRPTGQAIIVPKNIAVTKKKGVPVTEPTKKAIRLLCCAPSNAACDEIVRRLKHGVTQSNGIKLIPKIVRLGSSDRIHADVKDVTLDLLVEESFMNGLDYKNLVKNSTSADVDEKAHRENLDLLNTERDRIRAEQASEDINAESISNLDVEMRLNNKKRKEILEKMTIARNNKNSHSKALDMAKRAAKKRVLLDADVV